jgi:hypothetical protein
MLFKDLSPRRILPTNVLPTDTDDSMAYVKQHFSVSEHEVRQGFYGLGVTTSFFSELRAVLRHPPSPSLPIAMPTLRPPTNVSYSMLSLSGESDLSASQMSIDASFHPSSPSQHSGTTDSRGSIIEDKAESSTNQMAVTFLTILCKIERNHTPGKESHILHVSRLSSIS